ncbi:MAG: hypothetical protein ACFCA4_06030 [Cyanophyceae cyanobacterium]
MKKFPAAPAIAPQKSADPRSRHKKAPIRDRATRKKWIHPITHRPPQVLCCDRLT